MDKHAAKMITTTKSRTMKNWGKGEQESKIQLTKVEEEKISKLTDVRGHTS